MKKNEDYEDYKKTAQEICKGIALEDWKHKFGLTKMFFKAGIIGDLEDLRDDKIASILTQLQTFFRYQLAQKNYKEAIIRNDAIEKVQFNLRAFMTLKDWEWMKMIFRIKPLISQADEERKMKEITENYQKVKDALDKEKAKIAELEEQKAVIQKEKDELEESMAGTIAIIEDFEGKCEELLAIKMEISEKLAAVQESLDGEDDANREIMREKKKLEEESKALKFEIQELENEMTKCQKEKHSCENKTKEWIHRKLTKSRSELG